MIGPRPCAYACAHVDPVFTGQSYDISISISTRRTNLSVFLCLCFCLRRPSYHLLHMWCAYAYVYAYALVKTRLKNGDFGETSVTRRADLESGASYIGWVSATLCRGVNRPRYSHSRGIKQ